MFIHFKIIPEYRTMNIVCIHSLDQVTLISLSFQIFLVLLTFSSFHSTRLNSLKVFLVSWIFILCWTSWWLHSVLLQQLLMNKDDAIGFTISQTESSSNQMRESMSKIEWQKIWLFGTLLIIFVDLPLSWCGNSQPVIEILIVLVLPPLQERFQVGQLIWT